MFLLDGFEDLSFVHTRRASGKTPSAPPGNGALGQPFERLAFRWSKALPASTGMSVAKRTRYGVMQKEVVSIFSRSRRDSRHDRVVIQCGSGIDHARAVRKPDTTFEEPRQCAREQNLSGCS